LNNGIQFVDAPFLLTQLALGLLLLVRWIAVLCNYPLQILEYKLFQHHGPDVMSRAFLFCAIVGAGVALLLMRP